MAAWERTFDDVVRNRGGALLRYAYLLAGNQADAADLVQDGLLRTFRRVRLGTDLSSIEGYVRRAILTAYLDGRRRQRRFTAIHHLLPAAEASDGMEESVVTHDSFRRALAELSPRQRACVVLRYYEDLQVADIAAQLGCSQGSVKRYLSEGLARMAHTTHITEKGSTS